MRGRDDRRRAPEGDGRRSDRDRRYRSRSRDRNHRRERTRSPDRHRQTRRVQDNGPDRRGGGRGSNRPRRDRSRSWSKERRNRRDDSHSPRRRRRSRSPHRRQGSQSPPPQKPRKDNDVMKSVELASNQMDVKQDGGDDMDAQMKAMMGFGDFGTTKQKKVQGNDAYVVRKEKKTEYRQYMNRLGGFNRPLSPG